MKKQAMFIILFFLTSLAAKTNEIKFVKNNLEKAIQLAQKTDKIIFVDAYASWCGPCMQMANSVFTDDSVADFYNKHFINLKIDTDTDEGDSFSDKYPVKSIPTFYFINQNGEVIKKSVGGMSSGDFIQMGRDVLFPEESDYYKMTQKYKNGERDKGFLFKYLGVLADEGKDYTALVEEYFKGIQPPELDTSDQHFAVFLIYPVGVSSKFAQYFGKNYEQFYSNYGQYAETKLIGIMEIELDKAIETKDKSILQDLYAFINSALNEEDYQYYKDEIEKVYNKNTNL